MRQLRTLIGYEYLQCVISPFFYNVGALFILLMGLVFFFSLKVYADFPQDEPFIQTIFKCFWLPSLLIIPILTTRAVAFERSAGYLNSTLVLPINSLWIILSKFIAIYTFYTGLWLLVCFFPEGAQRLCRSLKSVDDFIEIPVRWGGFFFLALVNALLISFGLLCSTLARHPLTAIASSAAGTFIFLISGQIFKYLSVTSLQHGDLFDTIYGNWNVFFQLEDFCRAIFDTRIIVGYISLTSACLLFSALMLRRRA